MANSNVIRHALNVINRVIELRNAGLKLKEHKNVLREMLADNAAEIPAVVCVAVSRAIKSASNESFFSRLIGARVDVLWLLKAAEQMDAMHAEALEENARFDWLSSRFGVFHAASARVKLEMIDADHIAALRLNTDFNLLYTKAKGNPDNLIGKAVSLRIAQ